MSDKPSFTDEQLRWFAARWSDLVEECDKQGLDRAASLELTCEALVVHAKDIGVSKAMLLSVVGHYYGPDDPRA